MPELVALALRGGPAYVDAIRRVWDAGDAIAPLDHRLPPTEAERVLAALAPSAVIEDDGERRSLEGGTPVEPGDAAVVATSGTTGRPKAVIHTHDSVRASALATSAALDVDPAADRWLACLPLAHIGGLAVVMRSIVTATPVEVHDGFDPDRTNDAARRGATLVSLVTRALVQVRTDGFRAVLIGGAAPPPDRAANVIATYGLTESGSGVVYERRPLEGVELDISPAGDVRLRGPMLFRGYRHDPDPFEAGGWFNTGDAGEIDADGRLRIHGRRGDVIVTGGEKVWPAPIETLLAARPDVAEVALVGRPHPEWGHQVVAALVPVEGVAPPTLENVREMVKAEFGAWCAPRLLEIHRSLPKTALGKIRRADIVRPAG
ncbi:MAG: AMP-binding protein [Actinomycetota bacterium]